MDSRSLAALATRRSRLVSELIESLGVDSEETRDSLFRNEAGIFDIATAIPAVHALCCEYTSSD